MELLKELCECSGIPGREQRLREIARRELEPVADEITVDALGNLIARKAASPPKGKKKAKSAKKLMIAAHMDEIGFVVSHIDDKGWIRLVPLGGHNTRNMVAQRVIVCGTKRDLPGLLYPGVRPPHIATPADLKKDLQISDFFVDLCLPAKKVKEEVEVGAMVVIDRQFAEIGDGVSCKALDNRVSMYVMIKAMQAASGFGFETYAVATTQEEVGLRGATTSAFDVSRRCGNRPRSDPGRRYPRCAGSRESDRSGWRSRHQDPGQLLHLPSGACGLLQGSGEEAEDQTSDGDSATRWYRRRRHSTHPGRRSGHHLVDPVTLCAHVHRAGASQGCGGRRQTVDRLYRGG